MRAAPHEHDIPLSVRKEGSRYERIDEEPIGPPDQSMTPESHEVLRSWPRPHEVDSSRWARGWVVVARRERSQEALHDREPLVRRQDPKSRLESPPKCLVRRKRALYEAPKRGKKRVANRLRQPRSLAIAVDGQRDSLNIRGRSKIEVAQEGLVRRVAKGSLSPGVRHHAAREFRTGSRHANQPRSQDIGGLVRP